MKKVIIACTVFLAGFIAQAQDKGMKFGVKLGPNFSTVTGDMSDAGAKVGVHAGIFAEFMFNENFGIQPELLLSLQGSDNDYYYYGNFVNFDGVEKVNLTYLTLPVMVTYHFNRVKGLSVQAGPQVGFLLAAKEKGYFNGASYDEDAKDRYNSIDVGIGAGAQYEFPFKLIVGIRGIAGLTNIYDGPGSITYRNNVIQISAGYSFL